MIDTLNPQFLRTFIKSYEVLNFTKTSKILGMTQSGVSQHIQALEEILNKNLFERVGKKVFPTTTANDLYEYAKKSLFEMNEFVESTRSGNNDVINFRINAPGSYGGFLLNEMIHYHYDDHPLAVEMEYGPNNNIIPNIKKGIYEFGFITNNPSDASLVYENVFDEEYVLLTKKDEKRKFKIFEEFISQDFIRFPNSDYNIHLWISTHFPDKLERINEIKYRYYVNNMEGIIELVSRCVGAAVLPIETLHRAIKNNRILVQRPFKTKRAKNAVFMVYRPEMKDSKKYKILKKIISRLKVKY